MSSLMIILLLFLILSILFYCKKNTIDHYDPNPCYSKNVIMNSCLDEKIKLYQADNPYNYARPIKPDYNGIFSSWNCGCQSCCRS